jgi:hypothetical protein
MNRGQKRSARIKSGTTTSPLVRFISRQPPRMKPPLFASKTAPQLKLLFHYAPQLPYATLRDVTHKFLRFKAAPQAGN